MPLIGTKTSNGKLDQSKFLTVAYEALCNLAPAYLSTLSEPFAHSAAASMAFFLFHKKHQTLSHLKALYLLFLLSEIPCPLIFTQLIPSCHLDFRADVTSLKSSLAAQLDVSPSVCTTPSCLFSSCVLVHSYIKLFTICLLITNV